jgi:hypothetical protein
MLVDERAIKSELFGGNRNFQLLLIDLMTDDRIEIFV